MTQLLLYQKELESSRFPDSLPWDPKKGVLIIETQNRAALARERARLASQMSEYVVAEQPEQP